MTNVSRRAALALKYNLDDPALLERTLRGCKASGVSLAITEPRIITQLGRSLLGEVKGWPSAAGAAGKPAIKRKRRAA